MSTSRLKQLATIAVLGLLLAGMVFDLTGHAPLSASPMATPR